MPGRGGSGKVFWLTDRVSQYSRGHPQSKVYEQAHDGKWADYKVPIKLDSRLRSLRIDPSTAPATVDFDWIKLCGQDRKILRGWDF